MSSRLQDELSIIIDEWLWLLRQSLSVGLTVALYEERQREYRQQILEGVNEIAARDGLVELTYEQVEQADWNSMGDALYVTTFANYLRRMLHGHTD